MKKYLYLFAVVVLGLAFLASCSSSSSSSSGPSSFDDIYESNKYDFVVDIDVTDVSVEILGDVEPQSVTLKIKDTVISLDSDLEGDIPMALWMDLMPGKSYKVELTVDGTTSSANVLWPGTPILSNVPTTYDPAESFKLEWSYIIGKAGKVQVAYVGTDDDDHYKELNSSAKSYTFPANCVPSASYYYMGVSSTNFATSGKVAFMVSSGVPQMIGFDF